MLILDGVYTQGPDGPRFHRVTAPNTKTLERLLNRLIQRIIRRLSRDGLIIEDSEQHLAQLALNLQPSDALDHLNAASTRYRIAVGQGAGGRTLTLKNAALNRTNATPKPFTANQDSFSLNCAVSCQPHQRDRLERLCRYIARPALSLDHLSVNAPGARSSTSSRVPSTMAPLTYSSVRQTLSFASPRSCRDPAPVLPDHRENTRYPSYPRASCTRSGLHALSCLASTQPIRN